jgi:ATP-binding cassette subfamily F protein uup
VLEALQQVSGHARTSAGEELAAGALAERFGFRGEKLWTATDALSGGERRRLQLMRLLLAEPNVLLLDEPTNDLDIDTLTALEDLLDGWPGTLVVVSHDRYFVERVCDDVYALPGDGSLRHLPGGIEQYLQLVTAEPAAAPAVVAAARPATGRRPLATAPSAASPGAQRQAARRELARVERELARAQQRGAELQTAMAAAATDAARLSDLTAELSALTIRRDDLESRWLELSERLDG